MTCIGCKLIRKRLIKYLFVLNIKKQNKNFKLINFNIKKKLRF